jgi:hypothetical protein
MDMGAIRHYQSADFGFEMVLGAQNGIHSLLMTCSDSNDEGRLKGSMPKQERLDFTSGIYEQNCFL